MTITKWIQTSVAFYDLNNSFVEERMGSDVDMNELQEIFQELNFKIKRFDDLTQEDIKDKLDDVLSNKNELRRHDCFVAIFSSHGDRSLIFDKHGEPLLIEEIISKFWLDRCPELINKPKVFVFLCCRGGKLKIIIE